MKTVNCFGCHTLIVGVFAVSAAFGQECVNNIDCNDGDACTFDRCIDTVCTNTPAAHGDVVSTTGSCGPDGLLQVQDLLAVFDGFSGVIADTAPGCSQYSVDLGGPDGCGPDGEVNLYDVLAVHDAFIGMNTCCRTCADAGPCDDGRFCNGVETCDGVCGVGWADAPCAFLQCDEANDSCFSSSARVTCDVSPQRVPPGGTVTVDLFLEYAKDVGGYQAGIDVTRLSGSGDASCVGLCGSFDFTRSDHVFPTNPLVVPDNEGLRIVGTQIGITTGVDVGPVPAYMGSFELTISEDAAVGSTFEIVVRQDQILLSPDRHEIPYAAGPAYMVTVAPTDCNSNGIPDRCDLDCSAAGCDTFACDPSPDCNENDNPDECDLAQGLSEDCPANPQCGACVANGIPDECDRGFRMFWVPAGEDPTNYADGPTVINAFGQQGGTIAVEAFIQYAPDPVRGVGAAFPCVTPGAGGGSIAYVNGSGSIDTNREDYLFFDVVGLSNAVDETCSDTTPNVRVATARNVGALPVCEPKYCFGCELAISPDANGVITIDFTPGYSGDDTVVIDVDALHIPGVSLESLVIDLSPPDCDGNGVSDHCDIACGSAGGECDVAGCGTRLDCNANGVPDRCDVAAGTSGDCTEDGVPDECEPDCDSDGVADGCALLHCAGAPGCDDCDENGIPDSCDIASCSGDVACEDCNSNGAPDDCDIAAGTSRDDNNNDVPDECDSPSGDEPRLFLVPKGANPSDYASRPATVISLQPGKSRTLQVWVQKSGRTLGGYQAALDDASGGESGAVPYVNPLIDQSNPNWVHTGLSGVASTNVGPPARMTSVALTGAPTVTDPRYCGEITYTAALNACGSFAVDFVYPGTTEGESQTLLFDGLGNPFDFTAAGATIRVSEKVYGDVNGDGLTDVFDILCVLDGFEGTFVRCDMPELDIAPCGGNDVISLEDILAVLNGFAGDPSPCAIECSP